MKAFRNESCKKMMWNEMNNGRKNKWIDCVCVGGGGIGWKMNHVEIRDSFTQTLISMIP